MHGFAERTAHPPHLWADVQGFARLFVQPDAHDSGVVVGLVPVGIARDGAGVAALQAAASTIAVTVLMGTPVMIG